MPLMSRIAPGIVRSIIHINFCVFLKIKFPRVNKNLVNSSILTKGLECGTLTKTKEVCGGMLNAPRCEVASCMTMKIFSINVKRILWVLSYFLFPPLSFLICSISIMSRYSHIRSNLLIFLNHQFFMNCSPKLKSGIVLLIRRILSTSKRTNKMFHEYM